MRALVEHLRLAKMTLQYSQSLSLVRTLCRLHLTGNRPFLLSVVISPTPRNCNQMLFVGRKGFEREELVVYALPGCAHTRCRKCFAAMDDFLSGLHRCVTDDDMSELRRLMDENSWRDCPGTCAVRLAHHRGH